MRSIEVPEYVWEEFKKPLGTHFWTPAKHEQKLRPESVVTTDWHGWSIGTGICSPKKRQDKSAVKTTSSRVMPR